MCCTFFLNEAGTLAEKYTVSTLPLNQTQTSKGMNT